MEMITNPRFEISEEKGGGGLCRLEVLDTRDMKIGAANDFLGEAFGVRLDGDLGAVSENESRIVIGDVIELAVGHADAERAERIRIHQVFDSLSCKHERSIYDFRRFSMMNEGWSSVARRGLTATEAEC